MGVRDEKHIVTDTVIERLTAVEDFIVSPDGGFVASIDAFGGIACHSASDGRELWAASVPAVYSAAEGSFPLLYSEGENALIAFYGGSLAAFRYDSGEMLWKTEYLQPEEGAIGLSPDGSTLACLVQELDMASGIFTHSLKLFAA